MYAYNMMVIFENEYGDIQVTLSDAPYWTRNRKKLYVVKRTNQEDDL